MKQERKSQKSSFLTYLPNMKYHYGILSTATIAPRFIQAIKAYGDEVYAIASRTQTKAEEMAAQFHIPKAYGSYEDLCKDEHIDIVYIPTPNGYHKEHIELALSYHKHVVVEKPFTLYAKDAKRLFQYAKEQGCFLMEAQKSVFLPATLRLKQIIDTCSLGKLGQIEMLSSFPAPLDKHHWLLGKQGGVLHASGTYTFEYLMFLLDDPLFEAQIMSVCNAQGTIEDVSIHIRIHPSLLANSHITMRTRTHNQAVFYFEKGYVEVPSFWKARALRIHPYDAEEQIEEFPVTFEMQYEVAHIHECIEQGKLTSDIMNPKRTIQCVQLVEELILAKKEPKVSTNY